MIITNYQTIEDKMILILLTTKRCVTQQHVAIKYRAMLTTFIAYINIIIVTKLILKTHQTIKYQNTSTFYPSTQVYDFGRLFNNIITQHLNTPVLEYEPFKTLLLDILPFTLATLDKRTGENILSLVCIHTFK